MECWSPVTVSLLEVDEASLGCMNSLRPRRQPEREAWLTGGSPCCERSELMWGKTEESGQSGEVYLANTWSCSGCRLASLQTLWHKAETLWHVFNFSWSSWLFSVISFSLSAFCETHTMQQSKHCAPERKKKHFFWKKYVSSTSLVISHCRLYMQSSFLLRQRWAARRFLLRRLMSWTNSSCSCVKTCCFSSCWKSFLLKSTTQSTENGKCTWGDQNRWLAT